VAFARAIYSKQDMIMLDDVFSGLDADTEESIFNKVFGFTGLLREAKATVILVTHAGKSSCSIIFA
jgi:ATP-binding cassette subfamily C (CFTR/MRP) protein 1